MAAAVIETGQVRRRFFVVGTFSVPVNEHEVFTREPAEIPERDNGPIRVTGRFGDAFDLNDPSWPGGRLLKRTTGPVVHLNRYVYRRVFRKRSVRGHVFIPSRP